jgi:hypothetical protein
VTDWDALPVTEVPVALLVYPCHDIDPGHIHPAPDFPVSSGPIHVERLTGGQGDLFIHDGRHRAIRAIRSGQRTIPARVLEH